MQQAKVASSHRRCAANHNPPTNSLCVLQLPTTLAGSARYELKKSRCRHTISRRTLLLLQLGLTAGVAGPSHAGNFILPLDATENLPKEYEDLTRRLGTALQDSISADLNGASENEIRRKADPAKGLVKEWVSKWRDDRTVRGSVSHDQMSAMISQLGSFYQKNGARAKMDKDTGNSLLNKLKAAEASLKPVETKKKGIFG